MKTRTVRIYEQADMGRSMDQINELTPEGGVWYSWILCGVRKDRNVELQGWKWLSGRPTGCYVTNDVKLAKFAADRLSVSIISNGTHAMHKVAGKLCG